MRGSYLDEYLHGLKENGSSVNNTSDIKISWVCERGLAAQITELREKRWLDENRAALASSNSYVEAHGLPLAKHRPY